MMNKFQPAKNKLEWLSRACYEGSAYKSNIGFICVVKGKAYATNKFAYHVCDIDLDDGIYCPETYEKCESLSIYDFPYEKIDKCLDLPENIARIEGKVVSDLSYIHYTINKSNYLYNVFLVDTAMNEELCHLGIANYYGRDLLTGVNRFGEFGVMPVDPKDYIYMEKF